MTWYANNNDNNDDLLFFDMLQKIENKELEDGGIKLWLYNTVKHPGEELNVSFVNTETTPDNPTIVSQFNISLDFTVTD